MRQKHVKNCGRVPEGLRPRCAQCEGVEGGMVKAMRMHDACRRSGYAQHVVCGMRCAGLWFRARCALAGRPGRS